MPVARSSARTRTARPPRRSPASPSASTSSSPRPAATTPSSSSGSPRRAAWRLQVSGLVGWPPPRTLQREIHVDVRIGLIQNPKEIEVHLDDDADPAQLRKDIEESLAGGGALWLTDRKGRQV